MDDNDDHATREAFDALRRSVEPTVDLDSAEQQFRAQGRLESPARHWVVAALAGAAAVALVIASVLALWPSKGSARVVATGAGPTGDVPVETVPTTAGPSTASSTTEPCGDDNPLFVYLNPGVSDSDTEAIRSRLEAASEVEGIEYMDREATYSEFLRLFGEQPDFVTSINPDDLPKSFRVRRKTPWSKEEIAQVEALPGVYRVEHPTLIPGLCSASPEDERAVIASTPATAPTTTVP